MAFRNSYLPEILVVFPEDICNLFLEAGDFIPKIFHFVLQDGLMSVLLAEHFLQVIVLETFFQDILQTKISRKKHLSFLLSEHPPEVVNHV